MKLTLHIGTEKTGTTALQVWLADNAAVLRDQGVWVPTCLGRPSHRALSVIALPIGKREDGARVFGLETDADQTAFRDRKLAALSQEVEEAKAAGCKHFFISSEHLQSRLRTPEMVQAVADIVQPLFETVEVVCFLRPQIDTAQSLASTGSRMGLLIGEDFFDRVQQKSAYYNYFQLLDRWAEAFGKDAVTAVPFKRMRRPITYFRDRFGLDPDADYVAEKRANSSVDYRVVALMNDLVRDNPTGKPGELHPMFRSFYLEELPCEAPLSLSREKAQAIQARFAASNRKVAKAWDGIEVEDLEPDWSRYAEKGTFELLDGADYSPWLRWIFGRFNADLALHRARLRLVDSQDAEAEGDYPAAIRHQRAALAAVEEAAVVDSLADWANVQAGHYRDRMARLEKAAAEARRQPRSKPPAGALRRIVTRRS